MALFIFSFFNRLPKKEEVLNSEDVLEFVVINLASASCSSIPTKENFDERQPSNIKEIGINNREEILRQKRYNELFEGIVDLNNKHTNKNEYDTLQYTVDKINDKVIVTINNNAPNKIDSIRPFYKVINDDIEIDKEKFNRNIIKVYLVGNDDNILKLKGEIQEKSGDELLVYFYKNQDRSYQNLGCFYTSTEHLLHVLSKYTHYFSIDDQSLKHICSSNDSDIKPTSKQLGVVPDDPHQKSIKQTVIQKPENVLETHLNDREYKTYYPNKKTPNSYEFLVENNNDLRNEDIDSDKLKFKGQKDNLQYEAPNYNSIYLENNKTNTESDIKEHPKDETEVSLRDKSTNVETITQNPVPCNTNINDGLESNTRFSIPHTVVPNLYNLVNKSPSPKPYLPWNIENFDNYGKPCNYKDKNITNSNPTGYEKLPSNIEVRNKNAGDRLNSAIQKLSQHENNMKNQGIVTITPILPVSLSPLPTPYLQTNSNPLLNIPYILPGLQNLPIKSSATTPSFNQKAEEQNHQNKINEELGKPRKSNIYHTIPHSLTSPVNNIISKPMISSPLQTVPTNVCNIPESTIRKNSENYMLSTGLFSNPMISSPLQTVATNVFNVPELTIGKISENNMRSPGLFSNPMISSPLQTVPTNVCNVPELTIGQNSENNMLSTGLFSNPMISSPLQTVPTNVCNVPELTIGKNSENKMLSTGLFSNPMISSPLQTVPTNVGNVPELTTGKNSENNMLSTGLFSNPMISSPLQTVPTNVCNVPELTIGKNSENKMLSTGLFSNPMISSPLQTVPTNVCNVPELTIGKNSENKMLSTGLFSNPMISSPLQTVPTNVGNVPELTTGKNSENNMLSTGLFSNPMISSPLQTVPTNVCNVPELTIGKNSENKMLSTGLFSKPIISSPLQTFPTNVGSVPELTIGKNSENNMLSTGLFSNPMISSPLQTVPINVCNVPESSIEKNSENDMLSNGLFSNPMISSPLQTVPTNVGNVPELTTGENSENNMLSTGLFSNPMISSPLQTVPTNVGNVPELTTGENSENNMLSTGLFSNPMISSPLQTVPTNVCNVPELTIGKNSENKMLSTGLFSKPIISSPLQTFPAYVGSVPELTIGKNSENNMLSTGLFSNPIISSSLQTVPTNVCNVPELTIGKNSENNMLSTGLFSNPMISSPSQTVPTNVGSVPELTIGKNSENDMLSTGLFSKPIISSSIQTFPTNVCNVPELTTVKNSENNMLSTGLFSKPIISSPLQTSPTNVGSVPELTIGKNSENNMLSTGLFSKPIISSSLQTVPTNVCNVPELTMGKNSENTMLSPDLSHLLASSSQSPETLTMSLSASPVSELIPPCTEILSEPKLPLQGISTSISDIHKINSLPIYNIPSVVPKLFESVSSTLEAPPLQAELATPITETLNKPMSSLVNSITKLDVPSISVIKDNDMSLSKVSDALSTLNESINPITVLPTSPVIEVTPPCTAVLEKDAPQIIPNIKFNVPKISVEKDSENFTQVLDFSTHPTTTNEASVTTITPTPYLELSLTPPCTDNFKITTPPQIVSTTISNVSDENLIKNATVPDSNIIFPDITNQYIAPTTSVKSPDFSPNFSKYFQPLTSSVNHVPTLQTFSKSIFPNSIKGNIISSIPHIVQTSPKELYFPLIKSTRPHNKMFKYPTPSHCNLLSTTKPMPTSYVNTSPKFIFPKASSVNTDNSSRKLLAVPSITIPPKSSVFGPLPSTNSPQLLSNNRYFDGNFHQIGDALLPKIPTLPTTAPYPTTGYSERYSPLPQELTNKFNLNQRNVFKPHLFNPKQSDSFDPILLKSNLSPQEPTSYFSCPFYTSEPLSDPTSYTKSRYFPYMDNTRKPLDSVLFPSGSNKISIIKSFSNQNQPHMHFPSKLSNNLPISNLPIDLVSTNTINNKPTCLPLNKDNPKKFRQSYYLPLKSDYCKSTQESISSTVSPLNLKLQSSYYEWPHDSYFKNLPSSCKSKVIYPRVPANTSPEYSSKVFEPRVLATSYSLPAAHCSKTPVSPFIILPTMNYGSNTKINARIVPSSNLFLPVLPTKDVISNLYATSNLGKQNLNLPIPTLPTSVSNGDSIVSPASTTSLPTTLDAIFSPTSFKAPFSSLYIMNPTSILSSPITTAPKLKTTSFNHPSLVFPYASSVELSPTISPSTVSSWPIASISNVKPKYFKLPEMNLPISLIKKDSTINTQNISFFPTATTSELTFPNLKPIISTWPITSTVGASPINSMPHFSLSSLRTKKPTYDIPIRPSTKVCVKNSPAFVPTCPVLPTPKLRMASFNPWTSCLSMPSSRKSDFAELPNCVSPLPISSTPESKLVNLQPSKSLVPVSPMIETNSEVPVLSTPQLSAFPKKVLGSTSYSFNIPSISDSMTSELDLTDLLARRSPLPVVPFTETTQPKSMQSFYYPKKTRVSANKFNQSQFIKICNNPDYFNLKSITQPQSTNTSVKYRQLFENPFTYNSPINYFKPKVVLAPQSSPDLSSNYFTGSYKPISYSDYVAPKLGSDLFWDSLSYKSDPSITCSNNNPDIINHYNYPTYKSSVALTKPNPVRKFSEKQKIFSPFTQENKHSYSYLSNMADKHQTFKLLPSEKRPSILTSKLSKKSKLKFNYTSPENLSSAPSYHKENVIKLSPYKVQNKFSNGKTFSPYLSPDKKTLINFDTKYSMNTPNLYQTFDKFIPSNLKVMPNEKLSHSPKNTFSTSLSIGLKHNNLKTYNLGPYAKDVCLSDKGVTIPIANICIAKYEPNRFEKFNIKTDNPDIELKMWLSKINSYKAKLVVEVDTSNVINFIPIVKNKAYYSPKYIQDTAKRYVEKYYGKPIVLNGTYSFYNPFALINVNEIKSDDLYVIWPTFCECGCNASGCQCCYK